MIWKENHNAKLTSLFDGAISNCVQCISRKICFFVLFFFFVVILLGPDSCDHLLTFFRIGTGATIALVQRLPEWQWNKTEIYRWRWSVSICSKAEKWKCHDDVIKWKHFPRNWPFVRGIHRSPVNSPHKGHWRGALVLSLICVWINGWVNNREAGD